MTMPEMLRSVADAAELSCFGDRRDHDADLCKSCNARVALMQMGFDVEAPGCAIARGYAAALEALERLGLAAAAFVLALDDYDFGGDPPGYPEAVALDEMLGEARQVLTKAEETLRPLVGSE